MTGAPDVSAGEEPAGQGRSLAGRPANERSWGAGRLPGDQPGAAGARREANKSRLYLVTNQPRRAVIALTGGWPAPGWLAVVTRAEDVANIPDADPAFAVFYGEDAFPERARSIEGEEFTFTRGMPRSPLAAAWDHLRSVRDCGLTAEQFARLSAVKAARMQPGVLPAFKVGLVEQVMAAGAGAAQ